MKQNMVQSTSSYIRHPRLGPWITKPFGFGGLLKSSVLLILKTDRFLVFQSLPATEHMVKHLLFTTPSVFLAY
jgi:hypothetical protein